MTFPGNNFPQLLDLLCRLLVLPSESSFLFLYLCSFLSLLLPCTSFRVQRHLFSLCCLSLSAQAVNASSNIILLKTLWMTCESHCGGGGGLTPLEKKKASPTNSANICPERTGLLKCSVCGICYLYGSPSRLRHSHTLGFIFRPDFPDGACT